MTNEKDEILEPTHVVDWKHLFADGTEHGLRLYVARDGNGWQLIAARKAGNRLLTRSELDEVIETVELGYWFDPAVRPITEADEELLKQV